MLVAIKLLVAVMALGEAWLFIGFHGMPSDIEGALAVIAGVAWVLSPLLALVLASAGNKEKMQKIALLITTVLSTAIAATLSWPWIGAGSASHTGLEPFVVPALQWIVVIGGLATIGVSNRRHRAGSMRT